MDGIPHYLIDEFMPQDEFNVMIFQKYAKKYMKLRKGIYFFIIWQYNISGLLRYWE